MYFEAPISFKPIKWKSILEDSATCHGNAAKRCHVACHVKGWSEEEHVSDHAQKGWFYNARQQTENMWNLMAPYRHRRTQSFVLLDLHEIKGSRSRWLPGPRCISLACWDYGVQSYRGHWYLSHLNDFYADRKLYEAPIPRLVGSYCVCACVCVRVRVWACGCVWVIECDQV